jgi:hypothetical protein
MEERSLGAPHGARVEISICTRCQAFWFDPFESLQLTPTSTLELLRLIADETAKKGGAAFRSEAYCPKCRSRLRLAHDRQRNTPFTYWKCERDHGRFTRFTEFLKEKEFVRVATPEQVEELRRSIRMIHCSNCGAPIDLARASSCGHCASPISMLDMRKMVDVADAAQAGPGRSGKPASDGRLSPELLEILTSNGKPGMGMRGPFSLVEWGMEAFVGWLTRR